MLIVITGDDVAKISYEAKTLVSALQKKQPDADLIEIDDTEKDLDSALASLSGAVGMFFSKSLVWIHNVLPNKDNEAAIKRNLSTLAESESVFIFSEPNLPKSIQNNLQKLSVTIHDYSLSTKSKKDDFNVFALAKSLIKYDRKALWVGLQDAKRSGVEAENIYGVLWWQVKTIIQAKSATSAAEAGLKPYSYKQAMAARLSVTDAKDMAIKLISAQYKAKIDPGLGLWVELEDFALSI